MLTTLRTRLIGAGRRRNSGTHRQRGAKSNGIAAYATPLDSEPCGPSVAHSSVRGPTVSAADLPVLAQWRTLPLSHDGSTHRCCRALGVLWKIVLRVAIRTICQ